jgi:ATP:ADP antiporter, AAA family
VRQRSTWRQTGAWLTSIAVFGRLLGIRPRDHRDAAVGFVTLLLAMAAHAVLEAARDALFLATLEPTALPWAYLAMAGLTLVAASFQRKLLARLRRRLALSLTLLFGAAVTSSFWLLSSLKGSPVTLVALYVWTGLLASVVVVQFWLMVGDVMDLGQAKRAFALIGGGGLLGATLGSLLASGALLFLPARSLPLVASALLLFAAGVPVFFSKNRVSRGQRHSVPLPKRSRASVLRDNHYLRQLLMLVLLGTIAVTGVDYVFKAIVAEQVPAERLADFFARYYALVNGLALAVQIVIAPRLLRSAGIHRTLLVMPVLVLSASLGAAVVGSLISVLLLKAADGALRHSVNRLGTEILYLPLSNDLRDRFKGFIEAIGQRGGQALASVLILATIALGGGVEAVAFGVVVVSLAWLLGTVGLEPLYVALFRSELKRGTIETRAEVPELDLRSLEALIGGLSSEDDVEVVAALDMFAAYEKTNLIPALILYHPSPSVVLRALDLLSGSDRADVIRVAGRLLRHSNEEVRAAALRIQAAHQPPTALLDRQLGDASLAVQATAVIGLVHAGSISDTDAERRLREIIASDHAEVRLALAQGLHLLDPRRYAWLASELAARDEPGLSGAIAHSLALVPDPASVPTLLRLLSEREARSDARQALVALGDPALDALERALGDAATPRALRRHLPRTISRFPGSRPAAILQAFLAKESDDVVVFKILRGMGRMRADDPQMPVDRELLESLASETVARAVTVTYWRHFVATARRRLPTVRTHAAELLMAALFDHADRALEKAFRLMHILDPTEELELVYDALKSSDREVHARGRELLEHVMPGPFRHGILALVDDLPVAEQLGLALKSHQPPGCRELLELDAELEAAGEEERAELASRLLAGYAGCLATMLDDRSRVIRAIAGYHLAELDVASAASSRQRHPERARTMTDRAVALLALGRRREVFGAG